MSPATPRLRDLPLGARLGLACLVLTMLGGFAAALAHTHHHHQNRDERPGVSLDDVAGAYHGVRVRAPLLGALERGHPETLAEADRRTLLAWLSGTRISEDYDNLDLGASAPVEILARSCLGCHSRKVADANPIARTLPLDYFDDVKKIAFSREINPVDIKILAASTHTHALSLASLTAVVAALLLLSSWPRRLASMLVLGAGLALAADLGAWWLARREVEFVYVVIGAGAAYHALMVLMLLAVLIDLLRPRRGGGPRAA
ncbi:MAG TPA: hypothetical protein VD963_03915 [Phycisphaerales bacterium]|nr:hypothetical protein [Phycisphaerales bacterium]